MAPKKRGAPEPEPAGRNPSWSIAAVTEVLPETGQACWEIRGYSALKKQAEKRQHKDAVSPVLLEVAGARFRLEAYFSGQKKSPEGMFGLFCAREKDDSPDATPVFARFEITVVAKGGSDMTLDEANLIEFLHGGYDRGWVSFGKIDTLEKPPFLVDDTLIIGLQVSAFSASQKREWTLPRAPGSHGDATTAAGAAQRRRTALVEDLAGLLAGGQGADVEISSGLGEDVRQVLKAHRVVLAARSPVFNRMLLQSGMRESQVGAQISLDGVDHSIAEQFVRFLYTEELDPKIFESPDAVCHLLALGHRYEVRSLFQICSDRLTITVDTAIEQLVMAEQFSMTALKEQVMEFICSCRKRLAQVQRTAAFERMSKGYPQLMVELFAHATQPPEKKPRASAAPPSDECQVGGVRARI